MEVAISTDPSDEMMSHCTYFTPLLRLAVMALKYSLAKIQDLIVIAFFGLLIEKMQSTMTPFKTSLAL